MKIILNFHGLGPPPSHVQPDETPYWLPVDRFAAILDLAAPHAKSVAITFDDGNSCQLEYGLPLLQRVGLRAKFFVVTDRIGRPGYLSAADIKVLRSANMGIGSHGAEHVKWTELTSDELSDHVTRSLAVLSEILGEPVNEVAIPFGACNHNVLSVLRRCGVARVYTSGNGYALANRWLQPRNSIRSTMRLEEVARIIEAKPTLAGAVKTQLRQLKHELL